jgi:hypothetical protein
MGNYIDQSTRQQLANNIARLYSLEELAILKIDTYEKWLAAPCPSPIRELAWTSYSSVSDAVDIKFRELHEAHLNPQPEEVSLEQEPFIP